MVSKGAKNEGVGTLLGGYSSHSRSCVLDVGDAIFRAAKRRSVHPKCALPGDHQNPKRPCICSSVPPRPCARALAACPIPPPPPLGARARGRKPAAPAGLGALGSAWEWAAVFGLLRSLPYSPHCGTRTRTRPYKLQLGGDRHLNPALPHGREPPASPSPSPAASRRLHSSRSEIPRSEVESGKMRSTAGIRPFWMCRT
jgi:hypothetical protein